MNAKTITLMLAVALLAGATSLAGPLNPPAGPVTSTYKTLSEVEPRIPVNSITTPGSFGSLYKITQPGSYYLTGNIYASYFSNGIEIATSDVTLDLNGFAMIGTTATNTNPSAVIVTTPVRNITIRNGTARGWPAYAFKLDNATDARLVDVTATANGNVGILLGMGATATRCVSTMNAGAGIQTGINCILDSCTTTENTGNSDGISMAQDCQAHHCTSSFNGGIGIYGADGALIESCTANNNSSKGIEVADSATVDHCIASANADQGIQVNFGCVVTGNNAANNTGTGTAGIAARYGGNRIEGNMVTYNPVGIRVDGANSLVIRNFAHANTTSWLFVANTVYGALVDRIAPASPAISGRSAPATIGTTDPTANITY